MIGTTRELWVSLREQEEQLLSSVCPSRLHAHSGPRAKTVAAMGFSFSFTQATVSNIRQVCLLSDHYTKN
jgi:hypothetical protein